MPYEINNTNTKLVSPDRFGTLKTDNLKGKSYSLVESNAFTQTLSDSFGPKNTNEFKATSEISIVGTKKIFSICSGTIFIQPQSGNEDKVNLILRPFKQPFEGLPIKYFIYRGLLKGQFFDGLKVLEANSSNSEFINIIRNDFNQFYEDEETDPPLFLAKFLGFPENVNDQAETDLIDKYFFKLSEIYDTETGDENPLKAFELPTIPAGCHLATIVNGAIGIDIILDNGSYLNVDNSSPFKIDLKYARLSDCIIDLSQESDNFRRKLLKDATLQFIDLAAFYGLHTESGKIYVNGQTSSPLNSGNEIYTNLISKFSTKNNLYLYIQSNRQRFYNFYDNYKFSPTNSNNLKIGSSDTNMPETTYGTSGWPIYIYDQSLGSEGELYLSLVASTNPNKLAFYGVTGEIQSNKKRKFIKSEDLVVDSEDDQTFSQPIIYNIPSISESGIKPISNLLIIQYQGKELLSPDIEDADPTEVFDFHKTFDSNFNQMFGPITISDVFSGDYAYTKLSISKLTLINNRELSYFGNQSVLETNIIFDIGRKLLTPEDEPPEYDIKQRVLITCKKTESLDVNTDSNSQKNLFSSSNSGTGIIQETEIFEDRYFFKTYNNSEYSLDYYNIKDDNDVEVKLLALRDGEFIDRNYLNLGITLDEFNSLKALIPSNSYNVRLYLKEDFENPRIDSLNGFTYYKYALGIIYEDSTGELKTFPLTPSIHVYGKYLGFFTSKDYAEYSLYKHDAGIGEKFEEN